MDKEKLINSIMKEAEADGEPLTREEAEEIAEMEIKAKDIKRYEQSDKKREKRVRERKVDEDKKTLLEIFEDSCHNYNDITNDFLIHNIKIKNETELSFDYKDNNYTLKLIKHRKIPNSIKEERKNSNYSSIKSLEKEISYSLETKVIDRKFS